MFQQQGANANYQNTYYIELQPGTTYVNNSGNQGNGINVMTINRNPNQNQQCKFGTVQIHKPVFM